MLRKINSIINIFEHCKNNIFAQKLKFWKIRMDVRFVMNAIIIQSDLFITIIQKMIQ